MTESQVVVICMLEKEIKAKIIEKIFTDSKGFLNPVDLEKKYPPRELKEGAMVTRVAPSPTGPMHIGTLYMSLISERFAHQTDGVFFLRIEDTDKKREVAGATELITKALDFYGINVDEGQNAQGVEKGEYGPYTQSKRMVLYQTYIKYLLEKDLAYPCFCTTEELEAVNKEQELQKFRPGYYGKWIKCRGLNGEEVLKMLENSKSFVIRFKSHGNFENKIKVVDLLKGERELSENDQDIVIRKSDGLPTYHFAHLVDDHLMRTTCVLRGDEWLSSLPLHLQLFETMGWQVPQYGHISPIQKLDGTSKRKLSKRKDPEANVNYYEEQGYPPEAVIEYLLNLANSDFEDWRKANQYKSIEEFKLTFKKLAHSNGPLFDFNKLNDISKEVIAKFSAEKVYEYVFKWAEKYDQELEGLIKNQAEYSKKIFNIERSNSGGEKKRKDIAKWSDVKNEVIYFFDDKFNLKKDEAMSLLFEMNVEDIKAIVSSFLNNYKDTNSKDEWLAMMRKICVDNGYAETGKIFKSEPEKYKGHLADVAKVFRVLLTGKTQTPDLYEIMQVMEGDRVRHRLI